VVENLWAQLRGDHPDAVYQPAPVPRTFLPLGTRGGGVIEARYQPMEIAAAEAQWTTCQPCSF
jgi:hypothetical protein